MKIDKKKRRAEVILEPGKDGWKEVGEEVKNEKK